MRKIALLLVCMASSSHGRRVQAISERGPRDIAWRTSGSAPGLRAQRISRNGASNLAKLLLSFNQAAAQQIPGRRLRSLKKSAGVSAGFRASPAVSGRHAWAFLRSGSQGISMGESAIPVAVENPIPLSNVSTSVTDVAPEAWSGDLLALCVWGHSEGSEPLLTEQQSAVDSALGGALSDLIADFEFKGNAGSTAIVALPRSSPVRRLAVIGLGNSDKHTPLVAKQVGQKLAEMAANQKVKTMAAVLPTDSTLEPDLQQIVFEQFLLGLSPDTRYKSDLDDESNKPPALEKFEVLGGEPSDAALSRARKIASGDLLTRGLVNSPANYLTPSTMAATAEGLAHEFPSLSLKILEQQECEEMGMGAYLGVSQGAIEPPKFIHLTYSPPDGKVSKKVALVGKGLTFDSGGYNIKVAMMELMKSDMGGAGAVLGAARAVAQLAPPNVEVHFIIASCENMVSAEAMRPGDILTASNGKTIEVLNTDAEGRLTLADALVYADRLKNVDAIVDIATLTGACIVALGAEYGACYCDDEELLKTLMDSAKDRGELLWQMPLAPEYTDQLKSPVADLKNLGKREGGSITAALFLKEFIRDKEKGSPDAMWAHLDIAGPAFDAAKGATGYGVRTLVGLVESMSAAE